MREIPRNQAQLNLFGEAQTFIKIEPCPSCGSAQALQIPGVGPHYKGLRCVDCDRFIRLLAKPRREA